MSRTGQPRARRAPPGMAGDQVSGLIEVDRWSARAIEQLPIVKVAMMAPMIMARMKLTVISSAR